MSKVYWRTEQDVISPPIVCRADDHEDCAPRHPYTVVIREEGPVWGVLEAPGPPGTLVVGRYEGSDWSTPVPEPGAAPLLVAGLFVLVALSRVRGT